MKIIIAGSRDLYPTFELIHSSLVLFGINKLITEVICGGAEGVDTEGDYYASHMALSVKYFPADWNEHGKAAGPRRNKEMADYSDALLLIWDGKSKGSSNMKDNMLKLKKPIYEVILRKL